MNTFLTLKMIHVFGVVIFLGNIIITGWWKVMADRTNNPTIIAFAQRQVTLTDFIFTAGGAAVVFGAGFGNALIHQMNVWSTRWLSWGFWLFMISGIIWVTVLIPVQVRQAKMARQFADGGAIPPQYWTLGRIWLVFGLLATLIPLANLYWMVFKPG